MLYTEQVQTEYCPLSPEKFDELQEKYPEGFFLVGWSHMNYDGMSDLILTLENTKKD